MPISRLPTFRQGQQALSASGFNAMVAAIEDLQNQVKHIRQAMPFNKPYALNDTGADLAINSIVVVKNIDETYYDPTEESTYGQSKFQSRLLYTASKPVEVDGYTHDKGTRGNTVAVYLATALKDQFAEVCISGPIQVQVDVIDESHEWCDVVTDDTEKFKSGVTGSAYILSKEAGTGTKWAQVLLNAHHHAASDNPLTDLSGGWDLQSQGTVGGNPATGVKITINT